MKRATTYISKIRHKKLAKPLIPLGMRLENSGKTSIWCRTSVTGLSEITPSQKSLFAALELTPPTPSDLQKPSL